MPYIGKSTDGLGIRERFTYIASANATSISGADANSRTLAFEDPEYVDVFLNGVRLKKDTDYNTNTANTIAGLSALAANDEVEVIVNDIFTLADMVNANTGGDFRGNLAIAKDSAVLSLGLDKEITLTHDADKGLKIKNTSTTGNSGVGAILTLQTGDTDVAVNNVLGDIQFQAPDEGTGTDAILVGAAIKAISEGNFSSSNNATKLSFHTAASEAAAEKMSLSSAGILTVSGSVVSSGAITGGGLLTTGGNIVIPDAGTIGSASDTNALAISSAGVLTISTNTDSSNSTTGAIVAHSAGFADDVNIGDTLNVTGAIAGSSTIIGTTITAQTAFVPDSSDGGSLGTASLEFSDLFLADGAVINFGDDQDITLTHTADTGLTLNGTFVANAITGTTITASAAFVPDASDGATLGSATLEFSDLFLADAGEVKFGADQDVSLVHDHNAGLIISRSNTSDNSPVNLTFQTGETDIAADDVLGKISFQAPDEATGTDAVLISAAIAAISEGDFSSSNNATKLSFMTGASEAAAEKMSLSSAGVLTVSGAITSSGVVTGTGFTIGSAVIAEAELELLDGVTAGTAIASKVVTTDANIDSSGMRNLTITGELDAATGDFSGVVDVAGTTTVVAITASGLVTANANMLLAGTTPTLTIGDAGAEDAKIVFDGNAQDFHIGLDDSADDLVIGKGSALGTTPAIRIDENLVVNLEGTTASTSATTGTLVVGGGAGIAADLSVGDDVTLISDAAVLGFGADKDVLLTHVHNAGLLLNSTMKLQFNDASQFVQGISATVLGLGATDEIDLTATAVDINGTVAISGDTTFETGADIITASAGTSNVRIGVNAGNAIESGGTLNTVVGDEAGTSITTGDENSLFGFVSGDAITTGIRNVAVGSYALSTNVAGDQSVAVGHGALFAQNPSGNVDMNNVAVGHDAGNQITTGVENTIVGGIAGDALTVGNNNTAVGKGALTTDTKGSNSTALGYNALQTQNFTSAADSNNTAVGHFAGTAITTGQANTLIGMVAGDALTDADHNVAIGVGALSSDTLGSRSTAIGKNSLVTQNFTSATDTNNTAVGFEAGKAVTTGTHNTIIGSAAGDGIVTGTRNTALGFNALGGAVDDGNHNTCIGSDAGLLTTGSQNTFVGAYDPSTGGSGEAMTTGSRNTILGAFNGNQNSLDIRTANNNIVISDGDGYPRASYRTSINRWAFEADSAGDVAYSFDNTNATNPYGVVIRTTASADNDGGEALLICVDSSTNRLVVDNRGNVTNVNNSYGAISDVKLKEQITNAPSQWNDIKSLTVRKYKMKEEVSAKGDSDALWKLGVVAQEVETAGMNGLVDESIDRDSDMADLGTTTKSIKYSILYMKAIKALQEAMTRIETLETKVAALEG